MASCVDVDFILRLASFSTAKLAAKVLVLDSISSVQFSRSVVSDSLRPHESRHASCLSITNSQSLTKLMSVELVMPSSHLILCRPLLLLPPITPSIIQDPDVNSSHEVAKILEFQLQHQSFQ